jgi:uncharacterized protein
VKNYTFYNIMYTRKKLQNLQNWAEKPNRKPLVLRGARQVGKTSVVHSFGQHYKQYIYLNLEKEKDSQFFELTDINEIMQQICLQYGKKAHLLDSTLLFIDEIQANPKAMQMLRYFYEELPTLKVIAAGSLLESLFDVEISFPVGRVEYMYLRPVNFEEFLNAMGETEALQLLQNEVFPDYAYNKLFELFHLYAIIGGMPEVVANFAVNKDFTALQTIYKSLLNGYIDDIEKYGKNSAEKNYLRFVIKNIYTEAGKRIKFEGFGNSKYKSREMGETLRTLEKAFLLKLLYPTTNTQLPIITNHKKSPRLQILDVGLQNYALQIQAQLINIKDLSKNYTGLLIEQLVGQELLTLNEENEDGSIFWIRDKSNTQAELDYLHIYNSQLIPIEVKSGPTGKLKSLHLFMEQAPHQMAIRFCHAKQQVDKIELPSGKHYYLLTLPYFMVTQINKKLVWFEKYTHELKNNI